MPDQTQTRDPDLTPLAGDYDIVGELGGRAGRQYLIAMRKGVAGKRRDDMGRVLIEVARPPEGDESHALDHLASDTKLLTGLRHRRLVCVLDGRWLGDDAFAVIREYVDDPSVADLLARGDAFTNTRIAALLREVHGVLQWARSQEVVHRHVTPDRLFLEPTSDRVRVTFGAGPLQRVRTTDPTTEDVITVVRLAVAMLTGGITAEEAEDRTFAELRPDLPDRLFEETERLLAEPATDAELTLYLALIGMADPVAEGETERDRIRAEVLEEQRLEREKLARERADLDRLVADERRKLAEEGEELRGAFAEEKARLEREFAAAQRLLTAERTEMQRIVADERAELTAKRSALIREMDVRLAEIERAAAADRAKVEELREQIREAGEIELERKRAAALEDLDDSEIRLNTGRYATPRFIAPKLAPLPELVFRRDEHLKEGHAIDEPTLPKEPSSVLKVVRKLRAPRRKPIAWRRWAVRGGVAAAIIATAGTAVVIESRTPVRLDNDTGGTPARAIRAIPAPVTPPVTISSPGGLGVTPAPTDSMASATPPSARPRTDIAAESARRDSVARANAAAALRASGVPSDSAGARPQTTPGTKRATQTRRDDQDLMLLSDSLANKSDAGKEPEPPSVPQPNGP